MNIQQLQYVLAIEEHRHFQKAADACFVTPATLSIMIKKLEEELDITIFDRSSHPIVPTQAGMVVIKNARTVVSAIRNLESEVRFTGNSVKGLVRIGILPTLAPYLSHLFLPGLLSKYPELVIQLKEFRTDGILEGLRNDRIDVGLMVMPSGIGDMTARHLFNERLLVFGAEPGKKANKHRYLLPKDIDINRLWLLEEEHCLRSQIMNLCSLKKKAMEDVRLKFEAGSIETLLNIVEMSQGITIIPELATLSFSETRKRQIQYFKDPQPVREISMVSFRPYVKENILKALETEIKTGVSEILSETDGKLKVVRLQL
jgi:LysR family transcriptional regulator, hydrogen peroxide-inducible genes activator